MLTQVLTFYFEIHKSLYVGVFLRLRACEVSPVREEKRKKQKDTHCRDSAG